VIAGLSEGFSFAYLKELFVIALLTIARGGHVDVNSEEDEDKSETGTEPVMVEHEVEPVSETKEASVKADVETVEGGEKITVYEVKKEEEAPKKKRSLPVVEVPEHLKDNQLLKVIKTQLQMLLDEMDNTKEEDWPSDKPKGSERGPVVRVLRSRMAKAIDSDNDCC